MESAKKIEHLLQLSSSISSDEMKQQLIIHINDLLLNDFQKLIHILYRLDVNENKLRKLLQLNPQTDAAVIIADLLIERQQQKIKTKESFRRNDDIPDEEKW
jgi:hypothetical protein